MSQPLYTFGYERRPLSDLVADLDRLGAVCIDVRITNWSHVHDWHGANLITSLGSRYEWVREFGNPNHSTGLPITILDPETAISRITKYVTAHTPMILLCYEKNPFACHRNDVAQLLAKRFGFQVIHLLKEGDTLPMF